MHSPPMCGARYKIPATAGHPVYGCDAIATSRDRPRQAPRCNAWRTKTVRPEVFFLEALEHGQIVFTGHEHPRDAGLAVGPVVADPRDHQRLVGTKLSERGT